MTSACFMVVDWSGALVGHRFEYEYEMKVEYLRKCKIRAVAEDSGENEVSTKSAQSWHRVELR